MTNKTKVRKPKKPASVEMPKPLVDGSGFLIAICIRYPEGGSLIEIYKRWPSTVDSLRLAEWLPRAVAWVEEGRR